MPAQHWLSSLGASYTKGSHLIAGGCGSSPAARCLARSSRFSAALVWLYDLFLLHSVLQNLRALKFRSSSILPPGLRPRIRTVPHALQRCSADVSITLFAFAATTQQPHFFALWTYIRPSWTIRVSLDWRYLSAGHPASRTFVSNDAARTQGGMTAEDRYGHIRTARREAREGGTGTILRIRSEQQRPC
jgi:hypothetical protein